MKQLILTLTALIFISLTPLKSQVFFTSNQQSVKVDFSRITIMNEDAIRNIEMRIEKGMEKLEKAIESNKEITVLFEDKTLFISFESRENNSFYFLGNEYEDLNEIEEGIEEEEKELERKGYFKFMNEWYPSLEIIDSMNNKGIQAGSFKFMGEQFAPMPSEGIFG